MQGKIVFWLSSVVALAFILTPFQGGNANGSDERASSRDRRPDRSESDDNSDGDFSDDHNDDESRRVDRSGAPIFEPKSGSVGFIVDDYGSALKIDFSATPTAQPPIQILETFLVEIGRPVSRDSHGRDVAIEPLSGRRGKVIGYFPKREEFLIDFNDGLRVRWQFLSRSQIEFTTRLRRGTLVWEPKSGSFGYVKHDSGGLLTIDFSESPQANPKIQNLPHFAILTGLSSYAHLKAGSRVVEPQSGRQGRVIGYFRFNEQFLIDFDDGLPGRWQFLSRHQVLRVRP